jgi:hypothetical protein
MQTISSSSASFSLKKQKKQDDSQIESIIDNKSAIEGRIADPRRYF